MNNDLDLLLAEIDFLKSELELQSNLLNEKLLQALAVEYTYESNRLDGSTLTLAETDMAIKIGLMIPGKTMAEYLSAINHCQAVQFIREQAADQTMLSEALLKQVHGILVRGINRDNPGVYRTQPLTNPDGYIPPPPLLLPELIADTVQWLRVEGPFMHPVLFAAETHQRLLALQPFMEANGACARLLMNMILLEEGYPLANIPASDAGRQAYFDALQQARGNADQAAWFRLIAGQVMADIKSLTKRLSDEQNNG